MGSCSGCHDDDDDYDEEEDDLHNSRNLIMLKQFHCDNTSLAQNKGNNTRWRAPVSLDVPKATSAEEPSSQPTMLMTMMTK